MGTLGRLVAHPDSHHIFFILTSCVASTFVDTSATCQSSATTFIWFQLLILKGRETILDRGL